MIVSAFGNGPGVGAGRAGVATIAGAGIGIATVVGSGELVWAL